MYSTKGVKQLTIDEILKQISEYDIFQYYIGKGFKIGSICSPLRDDRNPSFDVFYSPNTVRKIMFKDHGTGESGSCFDLVMKLYGVGFKDALRIIDNDFQLGLDKSGKARRLTMGYIGKASGVDVSKLHTPARIRVTRRPWNGTTDKNYWGQYEFTVKVLNDLHISPISAVSINRLWFRFKKNEPVYCYHFGDYEYKILQPNSPDRKWLTNSSRMQGWHLLPEEGEVVVITKSLKDVGIYYMLDIPAIAPQAESVIPSKEVIEELQSRFTYVISNYDYDRIGKISSQKMRQLYGIQPIMFTPEFEAKDASDFVKKNGLLELKEIIDSFEL
jgi:hypothetical protein